MADPLSIVSGAIAVCQVAFSTSNSVQTVISILRHRNDEFSDCMNKAHELQQQLRLVNNRLEISSYPNSNQLQVQKNAEYRVQQAKKILLGINDLANKIRNMDEIPQLHTQNPQTTSKRAWLRHGSNLKKLCKRAETMTHGLRDIYNSLLQISTSDDITKMKLRLEKIEVYGMHASETPEASSDSIESQLLLTMGNLSKKEELSTGGDVNIDEHSLLLGDSSCSKLPKEVVLITTRFSPEPCEKSCDCQCHRLRHHQTPAWAQRFIGAITLHGNATILLNKRPCDLRRCRRSGPSSTQFTWVAPAWTFQRAITYSWRSGISMGTRPSPPLRVLRVIPYTATSWAVIETGTVDEVRAMVRNSTLTPLDIGPNGDSPLKYALQKRRYDTYKFLLDVGMDPFHRDNFGLTSNQPAIDEELSHTTLSRGSLHSQCQVDILKPSDMYDEQDFSKLHQMVLGLRTYEADYVFNYNPRAIDTADANGRTCLLWAAWRGDLNLVATLLQYEADPNAVDCQGFSPLMKAAFGGHENCVHALLKAKAEVSLATRWGDQAIHFASGNRQNGHRMVPLLLDHGADVNAQGESKPLHHAANSGSLETLRLLLDSGAELEAVDNNNCTAASIALGCWNEASFLELMDRGAKLDFESIAGINVIHLATWCCTPGIWQILRNAVMKGRMARVDMSLKLHNGHCISHCYSSCRNTYFKGERQSHALEIKAFTEFVQSVCINEVDCVF